MLLFFYGRKKVKKKLPKGERAIIGKLIISTFLNPPPLKGSKVLSTKNLCMAFNCNKVTADLS